MVDRNLKNSPIQIWVVILFLVMAILNFVMIAELPFFVSGLQITNKADGSGTTLTNAVESPDNTVFNLYQNRRYDQKIER